MQKYDTVLPTVLFSGTFFPVLFPVLVQRGLHVASIEPRTEYSTLLVGSRVLEIRGTQCAGQRTRQKPIKKCQ